MDVASAGCAGGARGEWDGLATGLAAFIRNRMIALDFLTGRCGGLKSPLYMNDTRHDRQGIQ